MSKQPVEPRLLPAWPSYADDEVAAVVAALQSGLVNYWTGEECRTFEREYAEYVGVGFGLALANGSVALELALRVVGVKPGDEVIVTPRSFVASASSIVICGATPVFADIDRDSQNVTADTIAPCITERTRAIIVVHLAGWPCDMVPIISLAKRHGLRVIEDCAQAHGARLDGQPVGSFGDISAFSFCQDKIISTGGEGGMLVTGSEKLWDKAWSYKDHGKSYSALYGPTTADENAAFRWVHESFGSNLRLTEMQAAIGRAQLRKLDDWVTRRRANADIFIDTLSSIDALRTPVPEARIHHAYYKFYTFLQPDTLATGWTRERIIAAINALGVPCFGGSCSEIYREKAFRDAAIGPLAPLPIARELGDTALMFVVHPTLSDDDVAWMARAAKQIIVSALA